MANRKHYTAVISLSREMQKFGIAVDVSLVNVRNFTAVIDGLCKEGRVEDAEEVMKHMVGKGVEPNIFTYNVIMDGYCLRGQVDRARRIFDFMIGENIEPDTISYNILINGYCKKKKLAEAMQLFHEISQKGSKPDVFTYNTILHGLSLMVCAKMVNTIKLILFLRSFL
uniref:Pentatricopeptide repeat-containing protein At1g62720-like n=1 Tax=Nicotiana sylvestris TaxID=4096 RepID=A0A1U7X586_NICSY|nr:PREDICTED: pentatricopeptide repeat-containing protein At1g62720-like [Nicotiana sylvestris]